MKTATFLKLVRRVAEGDPAAIHLLPGAAERLLASCQENRMPEKKTKPVENRHRVPKKMWDRWSEAGRTVFNGLYESMRGSRQQAFLHSDTEPVEPNQWEVTAWNAAWTAASLVSATKKRDAARAAAGERSLRALDAMGAALAGHNHRWTRDERRAFDAALAAIRQARG